MQVLQRLIQTIHAQLRGLNATTKMLIGSLMIIIVMTLFLVALYAGRSSMAVLPIELAGDSRTQALNYLETMNISYQERDGRLYVPSDQKYTVLAQLHESRLIDGAQIDFSTLIEQDSPFRSRHQNQQRVMIAKMSVLGSMIEAMDDVSRAKVLIDQPEGLPGIGRANIRPEASVNVVTRTSEINQTMVDAIANLVASSVAGMPAENVTVVDARAGRSWRARNDEDLSGHRHLEIKEAHEVYLRRKIQEALVHIPGAVVSVNVIPDTTSEILQRRSFDEPRLGVAREQMRNFLAQGGASGGEPGVLPNTGVSIAGSDAGGRQMSDERSDTRMVPRFPEETSRVNDPRGFAQVVNTTIGVPKSYFVRLFRFEQEDDDVDPTAAQLDEVYERYADRLREYVRPLIAAGADGAEPGTVVVNMVHDFEDVMPAARAGASTPAAGGIAGEGVDGLVKYAGLGTLALISLAMMFLMVRRANTREELPTAQELVGVPPALQVDETEMVGEADEDAPVMEGIEMDDEALRHQQMLDQINDMISTDPDEAAGLLRRWMKHEQ